MRIIGKEKIIAFYTKHNQAKAPLESWHDEAVRSKWKTSHDIKTKYSSASFLAKNRVIFNIKGNDFRLLVQVIYSNDMVIIEKIGTHAEYDKWGLK
ncbi:MULTISPECIES: type II toxin-antitoxin system HigB family toxin [Proteus]|uniref:type II toxin-antitoxin system HigB family toxin n=1 Tax=Proteus TaxID=583 RepID=UPI000537D42A|nr:MULTISPECIES: type II toxin-antitoxin system HigB family toxin [Proteus]AUT91533.1 type II toxin-antitoxin system HigB family toxin [Proteus mirabilis]AYY81120.1 type II toxin-antitoxin system HigB family toxin [Proteus vulgaris]EKU3803466.1 type II toxin-antitoxin system HigB family toxin [Proteus mirabilis]EKY1727356.1 type II toxin-antitoxin system HigB family toxin [Proteus mirabilis]ELD1833792.1 type II toxin-antitoxin system HigB family toxin [Proteus mirabilis]